MVTYKLAITGTPKLKERRGGYKIQIDLRNTSQAEPQMRLKKQRVNVVEFLRRFVGDPINA